MKEITESQVWGLFIISYVCSEIPLCYSLCSTIFSHTFSGELKTHYIRLLQNKLYYGNIYLLCLYKSGHESKPSANI